MKDLTFIIPIRHPDNLRDRKMAIDILNMVFKSYVAQTSDNWRVVLVANPGTALPELPEGFVVEWVDFEPNPMHELKDHDFNEALMTQLYDKGRRVWAGLKAYQDTRYYMVMDDDDWVSRDLTKFVKENDGANGWYIGNGYGMNPDGKIAISIEQFHKTSGSSHIVRADLYRIPEPEEDDYREYIMRWLGTHGPTTELFEEIGKPLDLLPFHGAVYMVNNPNSHSNSNSLLRQYVLNKETFLRPWTIFGKAAKLRRVDKAFRDEFLGGV